MNEWIIFGLCIWSGLGLVGYFLMRQGFLVSYEAVLGKEKAWDWFDVILGIPLVMTGPLAIMVALIVKGDSCFERRQNEPS